MHPTCAVARQCCEEGGETERGREGGGGSRCWEGEREGKKGGERVLEGKRYQGSREFARDIDRERWRERERESEREIYRHILGEVPMQIVFAGLSQSAGQERFHSSTSLLKRGMSHRRMLPSCFGRTGRKPLPVLKRR
jgi:hypothetical protein